MFKKTVLAAAIATVSATAMADVSVSGRVEQGFADEDAGTSGWSGFTDNQINFKASEDLGNGMSAFAQLSMDADATADNSNLDQKLGLSGGFGTFVVGKMEDFSEGVLAATQSTMGTNEGELAGPAGRLGNAIAYVSPTVNGFHVGVAGYTGLTPSDNVDAVDIMLAYDNGPLSVKVAKETITGDYYDTAAVSAVNGIDANGATVSAAANTDSTDIVAYTASSAATEGTDHDLVSVALGYSMGDLSMGLLWTQEEGGSSTNNREADDLMLRLDYKMGANKLTLQHAKDESAVSTTADVDTTVFEVSHSFSKRTAAYVGFADSDSSAKENTYVGIQHTF